jgi:hypothetical protein
MILANKNVLFRENAGKFLFGFILVEEAPAE